ncbi:MAG: OstA-like protein, partial [Flavobacteriaceae bacterium]|nr:OstA-like protein [Eudoraea sp.]NNJ37888.1 OstA-like protein [Flavobacteriaceae bacterium]
MRTSIFTLSLCLLWSITYGQDSGQEGREINIVYGANFTKDEAKAPGASIFSKDARQVQFAHEGADLWCDVAIFYQKENRLQAIGNIRMKQG